MATITINSIMLLAFLLATGILLVILSCALFANWLPLIVIATWLLAPLPNVVAKKVAGSDSILGETRGVLESGYFATSLLVISGFSLPIVLNHAEKIIFPAMMLSVFGGILIYSTILGYIAFFIDIGDDDYF
ncbi:hypothetical protein SeMB42_g06514 [Synchytrium endobioticum]|uniref:Vacuolar protein sorting 55 n=1 Tax=Synchytrium endobioticum TaxID=286115 RepID=A0A507CD80_9FUNG|nr:hypothetical protein SeMB42_g06514 [Synchytrium endobioticum]TPX48959.1 hypothetical protein SeLEV6574_g01730 [Synchytrium endobioticum]